MDLDVDHYDVLGLPSGEEGAKLTIKEIKKAYRLKALELHPDKRPDDPNAQANFQKLQTSYELLIDEKAKKAFDDWLRVKRDKLARKLQQDHKRRKMTSDLEERERASFAVDPSARARDEEERTARQLREEVDRIKKAMFTNKASAATSASKNEKSGPAGNSDSLDADKMLKVSWEKIGEDYTAQRLKEIFSKFGKVEDVVIKSFKKKGSAVVEMASKDAAVAALGNVLGELSNPLLVLPLKPAQPATSPVFSSVEKDMELNDPKVSKLVGSGYQAFEDSVLEKMKKAAKKQK